MENQEHNNESKLNSKLVRIEVDFTNLSTIPHLE